MQMVVFITRICTQNTLQKILLWLATYSLYLKSVVFFLCGKSPLSHTSKITKPLLVIQGKNDPRVVKPESDETVEAVKENNVPVEYIVFEGGGYDFLKKENEIKAYDGILKFLDKHLKQASEGKIEK
jgi:alpha-beta hydrolase superfamily lysophospholipase